MFWFDFIFFLLFSKSTFDGFDPIVIVCSIAYICQMDWSSWMVVCLPIFRVQCSISDFVFCKYYHSIFFVVLRKSRQYNVRMLCAWLVVFKPILAFNQIQFGIQIQNCVVQPRLTFTFGKSADSKQQAIYDPMQENEIFKIAEKPEFKINISRAFFRFLVDWNSKKNLLSR